MNPIDVAIKNVRPRVNNTTKGRISYNPQTVKVEKKENLTFLKKWVGRNVEEGIEAHYDYIQVDSYKYITDGIEYKRGDKTYTVDNGYQIIENIHQYEITYLSVSNGIPDSEYWGTTYQITGVRPSYIPASKFMVNIRKETLLFLEEPNIVEHDFIANYMPRYEDTFRVRDKKELDHNIYNETYMGYDSPLYPDIEWSFRLHSRLLIENYLKSLKK